MSPARRSPKKATKKKVTKKKATLKKASVTKQVTDKTVTKKAPKKKVTKKKATKKKVTKKKAATSTPAKQVTKTTPSITVVTEAGPVVDAVGKKLPPGGSAQPSPPTPPSPPKPPPPRVDQERGNWEVPVALFPVRLTARYLRPSPKARPTHLRLRIHPDLVTADGHDPRLTEFEYELGLQYWKQVWTAEHDDDVEHAQRWLAGLLDTPRALWVARTTAPRNLDAGPSEKPDFPKVRTVDERRPTTGALLPERWVAATWVGNEFNGYHESEDVDRSHPLVLAPQLADVHVDADARRFLTDQRLAWRFDYDVAEKLGMAITIPLNNSNRAGFSDVIVWGTAKGDQAHTVGEVLAGHRYSHGLSFLAPGSPTNNTDTVESSARDDVAVAFATEFTADERQRPRRSEAADLYRSQVGDQLSAAFGLGDRGGFVDRTPGAGDTVGDRARAMQQVLWAGTAGHSLTRVLAGDDPLLSADDLEWVRDWYVDFVRGAPPLPTLRIGDLPYGVLPITPMPDHVTEPQPGHRVDAFSQMVARLGLAWTASRSSVATMSPVVGADAPGASDVDEAVQVAGVLGAVPHPTDFRIRRTTLDRSDITSAWVSAANQLHVLFSNLPKPEGGYYTNVEREQGFDFMWNKYQREYDNIFDGSVGVQYWSLGRLRDEVWSDRGIYSGSPNPVQPIVDLIDDVMRPMTAEHDLRSRMRYLTEDWDAGSLPTDGDPDLWYSVFEEATDDSARLVVCENSREWLATFLGGQIERVRQLEETGEVEAAKDTPVSLFSTLVRLSVETVSPKHTRGLREGLERLLELVEGSEVEDPVAEIRRLAREVLGLVTHRHDAWHTSVASARLAHARVQHPEGLRVGGFGWMMDVAPDDGGPDTNGFIHAPTLDHAATAAILRSAWDGLTDGGEAAAFAVDLSSDRVRRATWLLDGLRNGNELGELLGQRFERRMHDEGLDRYIDDVRRLVLADTGQPDRPPHAVVDGLALVAAHQDNEGSSLYDSLTAMRNAARRADRTRLDRVMLDTVADLDAVTDLLMADSVHALVKGNIDATAAALSVASSEPGGLPDPRVANIERGTSTITHRLVHTVDPRATPSFDDIGGLANPALAAAVEDLLPDPGTLTVQAVHRSPDGASREATLSLADFGISALSLLELSAPRASLDDTPVARLAAAWVSAAMGPGEVTLELGASTVDAVVVAESLRAALAVTRPIRPADLPRTLDVGSGEIAGDAAVSFDLDDLLQRHAATRDRLDVLLASTASVEAIVARPGDFVSVAPEATIAALSTGAPAELDSLWRRLEARRRRLGDATRAGDESDRTFVDRLRAEIRAATGASMPILDRFELTASGQRLVSLDDATDRFGSPLRARTWLTGVAQVHDDVAAWHDAMLCLETIRPDGFEMRLLQSPVGNDGWAAVDRLAPDIGSATCLVNTGSPLAASGLMCGLLIDAWTEAIPGSEVTTGVAVHFDSPSSRAPQAILLAVPPAGKTWDRHLVRDTLKQTVEVAQQRAVGPETLGSHGQFLPALFLPESAKVSHRPQLEPEEA